MSISGNGGDKMKLYLAHPNADRIPVRKWELQCEKQTGVELVNPFEDVERGTTYDGVVVGDLSAIDSCDGVLAVVTQSSMMGTPMEMFYAKSNHIPLIVISPFGGSWLDHPWVQHTADVIFESFEDFEFWYSYAQSLQWYSQCKIGLVGQQRSGKDTVGDYLISKYGFKRFAFADELKEVVRRLFGYSYQEIQEKPYYVRDTLQMFATEGFRKLYPRIWVDVLLRRVKKYQLVLPTVYSHIVVTDIRFQNEADALHDAGFELVKVVRETGIKDAHVSETELLKICPDLLVPNNGTIEELYQEVDKLLPLFEAANEVGKLLSVCGAEQLRW